VAYDELSPLGERYRDALASMYEGEPQLGEDGGRHAIDGTTRVSVEEGMTLHTLCVAGPAVSILEVGLAYGFSTLFLLAALERTGRGTLTSIDPFQATDWHGRGAAPARRLARGRGSESRQPVPDAELGHPREGHPDEGTAGRGEGEEHVSHRERPPLPQEFHHPARRLRGVAEGVHPVRGGVRRSAGGRGRTEAPALISGAAFPEDVGGISFCNTREVPAFAPSRLYRCSERETRNWIADRRRFNLER